MPQLLQDLTLSEISLVDNPANSSVDPLTGKRNAHARIALFKRDGTPNSTPKGTLSMTLEQIEKKLTDQDALLATMTAADAVTKGENSVLKNEIAVLKMSGKEKKMFGKFTDKQKADYMAADADKQAAMCKAFGEEDEADNGDSDTSAKKIAKLDLQMQEIQKAADVRIAKAEKALAAVTLAARVEHFTKRAELELPNTAGTPVEKAETLMAMADSLGGEDSAKFKSFFGVMKSADTTLGTQFVEKGVHGGGANLPAGKQLDAHAETISKRDKITIAKAYGVAMEEHPELVAAYDREARNLARNQ
jgi:hypothetical protein